MKWKLVTLHSKIKISWFWSYIEYKAVNMINCRVLPKVVPYNRLKYLKPSYFLLILYKNKENVTFTWPAGVQNVLFLSITGDKFVIYAPIRRYECTLLLKGVQISIISMDRNVSNLYYFVTSNQCFEQLCVLN